MPSNFIDNLWERHLAAIAVDFESDRNAAIGQKIRILKPV
jgi:hypothetical protein